MPELPEVETVVRLIRPALVGRRIVSSDVRWTRSLGGVTPRAFARAVRGASVASVERRGKYLIAALERNGAPGGALLCHLRMSGRLFVERRESPADPYLRVSLGLDDGRALRFVDVRKFGRFVFAREPELLLGGLGPEPLDEALTPERFARALRERKRLLKPLLLDQTFLAGLGNIYVDESLHRARLHPLARADRLAPGKTALLLAEIRATLREAIRREGSSFDTFYRTPEGRPGSYQDQFRVYGRQGRPCLACGATIRRIVVGQRGTHLCPRCQRAPRTRRTP